MEKNELEKELKYLKEEVNELREWREKHTKIFCTDCRREAEYNVRTTDGLNAHSCEKHSTEWLGCELTKRR